MTATELRDIIMSSEFKQDLEELSSYLASIMQERPIVYLLAKCLWKRRYKFELEKDRSDLFVNEKRIEFKFNYDKMAEILTNELAKYGDNLRGMWRLVQEKVISKSWGVLPKISNDVCVKNPEIFVWIICSRDVSKVADDDLERICQGQEQREYNNSHPYSSDVEFLTVADLFLEKLHPVRPFSVLKEAIVTNGDFPSTYHFRICDFSETT